MTPAAELTGAELIECVQGGVNVKQELTGLKTWVAVSIRVNAATYAAIPTLTTSCFVFVTADETNGGQPTIYFFDGTNLNWIPAIGV